jgi:uncharacterized membrane protein YcaP (DUF421 family)
MAPMFAEIWEMVDRVLGLHLEAANLGFGHMTLRAMIVFCVAVVLARVGNRRLLAHNAGFDIMLLVVLGSVLSRGINGQAAFFPTLGVSAVLVGLHHLVATLALHSHWFSQLAKGSPRTLVRRGQVDQAAMRKAKISGDDLEENLRLNGGVSDVREVAEARLERNGSISVVKARPSD